MNKRLFFATGVAGVFLAGVPFAAQAYVGPGAGISLLGALWALIAVIGSALLYVVLWPLRRLRKRRKQGQENGTPVRNSANGGAAGAGPADEHAGAEENER